MQRHANAQWKGGLQDGTGTISTQSGVLEDTQYSFGTRFEEGRGTNPEELIGAAHAGCFAMALSMMLGEEGLTADDIQARADVRLDQDNSGFTISAIHLKVSATIPGADNETFQRAAENAKAGCPVSKLFNATITVDAKLDH